MMITSAAGGERRYTALRRGPSAETASAGPGREGPPAVEPGVRYCGRRADPYGSAGGQQTPKANGGQLGVTPGPAHGTGLGDIAPTYRVALGVAYSLLGQFDVQQAHLLLFLDADGW